MKKALALVAILILAGFIYWKYYYIEPVPKPSLWGFHDPPVLINMSWEKLGSVEILTINSENASGLYGKTMQQLQNLGYSMTQGNWSKLTCQWSLWESKNRTYYIAYNGSKFLAVRGTSEGVLNASAKEWLCGKPSGSSIVVAPSPWKAAEILALGLGKEFMERNISIAPANWSGPLPDWYLAKFSFKAKVGDGVDVLILVYSEEDQVKYAEYLLKKADKLRFLESDAGQYRALIVLKGRRTDVDKVVEIIQTG